MKSTMIELRLDDVFVIDEDRPTVVHFVVDGVTYAAEIVTEFGETYTKLVVRLSKAGEVSAE